MSTVERQLSELISDSCGSDNWMKFLSTKKHYYNTIILYCTIIIKTKKLLKQVKHEELIHVIRN
jgi:hypothetical protein